MALTDSLERWWPMNAASGNETDLIGGSVLIENGTIGVASLGGGNGRDIDPGEYFTVADHAAVSFSNEDFTVQVGVVLDTKTVSRTFVGKWGTPQYEYIIYYDQSADRFYFYVSNGGTFTAAVANTLGSPSTGTPYLIHGQYDSVNNLVGIAVNAGTLDTASNSTGSQNSDSAFQVGTNDGSPSMDGKVRNIGVWRRLLSGAEKTQLYNGGTWLDYPFTASGQPYRKRLGGVKFASHNQNPYVLTW